MAEAESESACERKWEELPVEILASIFKNLNPWDLMFVAPLVCHPWSTASIDPSCWTVLDMRLYAHCNYHHEALREVDISPSVDALRCRHKSQTIQLLKAAVNRAGESIIHLILPVHVFISDSILHYISARTRGLKRLVLPSWTIYHIEYYNISEILDNWSELEAVSVWVRLGSQSHSILKRVIQQFGISCKNMKELKLFGVISGTEASIIASSLPKLKILDLGMSYLSEVGLFTLIDGCKELQYLNISHCEKLGSDAVQRAVSLVGKVRYCSKQVRPPSSCALCDRIAPFGPIHRCTIDHWTLEGQGLELDMKKIPRLDSFIPFYIVAVLSRQEQPFNRYLDRLYQERSAQIAWHAKERKRINEEYLKQEERDLEAKLLEEKKRDSKWCVVM